MLPWIYSRELIEILMPSSLNLASANSVVPF